MPFRIHYLKTHPEQFVFVDLDIKKQETRKNDRDYKVGDFLCLREWKPDSEQYTGRFCWRYITHILPGGQFGIKRGYAVLSIVPAPDFQVNHILMKKEKITPQTINKKMIWKKREGVVPADIRHYKVVEVRGKNPTAARVFICTISGKNPLTVSYKKFIRNYIAIGLLD